MELFPDTGIVFREPFRLLFIIPLVLFLGGLLWRKRKSVTRAFSDPWLAMHISGARLPSGTASLTMWTGIIAVLSLLILVLSEPERRHMETEPVYNATRLTFLFDSSHSMRFAEDSKPNRLEAGRAVIGDLVNDLWHDPRLAGNYSLALIPFAGGSSPLYLPFTVSRDSFLEHLKAIDENTITTAGTSVWHAIDGYKELLDRFPAWDEDGIDIAILISDGGKEDSIAVPRNRIAQLIKNLPKRVRIYTVGVGSRNVDRICMSRMQKEHSSISEKEVRTLCSVTTPVPLVVREEDGGAKYIRADPKDQNSPVLMSTLDEETLRFVAQEGRGEYAFFEDREKLLAIFRDIVLSNRKQTGTISRPYYEPAIVEFVLPAFVIAFFLFGFGGGAFVAPFSGMRKFFRHRP